MSPSMIDQLFRLTISEPAPFEIEDAINKFLPTKEDVQKKRRMHQDLWFFKDHYSVNGRTSYWTYSSEEEIGVTITDGWRDESVYCNPYKDRETQCIFANSFITWKDDLFPEQGFGECGREAYEKMLFDHDGEKTEPFRILTDTSEHVIPVHTLTYPSSSTPDLRLRNKGVFLGGGNEGDSYYTEHGQGLTILNIISRAMDGLYTVQWSDSGFRGDDTGEYENDVITIYKTENSSTLVGESCETFKKYIEYEHKKWSEDPEGEFTGLIIGGRDADDFSNLLKKTEEDEELFSIFVRPDWKKIEGGYWGYQRDELVDGKIVNGPRVAEQNGRRKFRSQNEMAAALERGIVMSSEIR